MNMKFILSTHNVTLTKAIEDHVLTRLEKLERLHKNLTSARATLEHDHSKAPDRQFICSIRLSTPGGTDAFAVEAKTDLYAAVDLVVKKLQQQLRKLHSKDKASTHTEGARSKTKRQITVPEAED
jgi:putative sigma-54 modulation protein